MPAKASYAANLAARHDTCLQKRSRRLPAPMLATLLVSKAVGVPLSLVRKLLLKWSRPCSRPIMLPNLAKATTGCKSARVCCAEPPAGEELAAPNFMPAPQAMIGTEQSSSRTHHRLDLHTDLAPAQHRPPAHSPRPAAMLGQL